MLSPAYHLHGVIESIENLARDGGYDVRPGWERAGIVPPSGCGKCSVPSSRGTAELQSGEPPVLTDATPEVEPFRGACRHAPSTLGKGSRACRRRGRTPAPPRA